MASNYRPPRKYSKARKYHGKCENCGVKCDSPYQHVDENNISITWHAQYLCKDCYNKKETL